MQLDREGCTILWCGEEAYFEYGSRGQPVMWTDPWDKWDLADVDVENVRVYKEVDDWENEK